MMRLLRRLMWLGVLAGGAYVGYRTWSRKQSLPSAAPEWPPLPTSSKPVPGSAPRPEPMTTTVETAGWLPPVDGHCPPGYPLKANENSGIFHVPGGRFYERTVAERCYANAEDAIADGYRQAKA
jgi:hypothetical protein